MVYSWYSSSIDGSPDNVLSPAVQRKPSTATWRGQPPTSAAALMWQKPLPHSPQAALTSLLIGRESAGQGGRTNGSVCFSRPRVSRWQQSGCGWMRGLWQPVHCSHSFASIPVTLWQNIPQTLSYSQSHLSHFAEDASWTCRPWLSS